MKLKWFVHEFACIGCGVRERAVTSGSEPHPTLRRAEELMRDGWGQGTEGLWRCPACLPSDKHWAAEKPWAVKT